MSVRFSSEGVGQLNDSSLESDAAGSAPEKLAIDPRTKAAKPTCWLTSYRYRDALLGLASSSKASWYVLRVCCVISSWQLDLRRLKNVGVIGTSSKGLHECAYRVVAGRYEEGGDKTMVSVRLTSC
jgi:hypothetical protein